MISVVLKLPRWEALTVFVLPLKRIKELGGPPIYFKEAMAGHIGKRTKEMGLKITKN
jgi:hypothetical protein